MNAGRAELRSGLEITRHTIDLDQTNPNFPALDGLNGFIDLLIDWYILV
jgi:hypothetical protein